MLRLSHVPLSVTALAAATAIGSVAASSTPAVADPAAATTGVSRQVDVNPGETNPCNGSTGTITDDEQDVFHVTELADGTYRLTGHSTVVVTFQPEDPTQPSYTGHETFVFTEASTSRTFTTTSRERVRMRGTDGSFLVFSELVHLTVTANGVSASFDRPAFICS